MHIALFTVLFIRAFLIGELKNWFQAQEFLGCKQVMKKGNFKFQ